MAKHRIATWKAYLRVEDVDAETLAEALRKVADGEGTFVESHDMGPIPELGAGGFESASLVGEGRRTEFPRDRLSEEASRATAGMAAWKAVRPAAAMPVDEQMAERYGRRKE